MLIALRRRSKGEIGCNGALVSMKSLIAILSISIVLLCYGVDLSAQEKKDDKRLEITGYFGTGGKARDGQLIPFYFTSHCIALGLEYYLNPRISVEGQITYLPNIAYTNFPPKWRPGGEHAITSVIVREDEKYRLLLNINLLFYFDFIKIKIPAISLYLSAGTGYQYDRVEFNVVTRPTLGQYKFEYGEFCFQWISIGAGFKVNITD